MRRCSQKGFNYTPLQYISLSGNLTSNLHININYDTNIYEGAMNHLQRQNEGYKNLYMNKSTLHYNCILFHVVFSIIKPTRCTNFTNLLWHETLHVSDSSSVHHQEFIHCTLSNGICHTAYEQDEDGTAVPSWSCSKAVYKPVWHIPLLSVQ